MTMGFKELSSVCDAIALGRQSLLLRKAGLRESTAESGFQTKYFYLLPTQYHEKMGKASGDGFHVQVRVEVIQSGDLLEWSNIEKLLPLTAYGAFLLEPEWHLPASPSLSGCRSWFELPLPPQGQKETPVPASETTRRTAELFA
ncbi:DUF1802 family protein [bacterium]|nr:DUF1802 family protein [bacterium]